MAWDELTEQLLDHRMDWANRAYESYMAELDPTIRKAAASAVRPKVDAALYGETQVGKTTMLLTLLGVQPARFAEVADTLRADRPRGMSSTPTATRYRASTDDRWTINVGQGAEVVSEPELRRRIAEVRSAVEGRRWSLETVVEIAIPARFFDRAGGNRARILDLPGVQAVNADESDHARRLIDKWVALADVVLLVTRIDRLTPLRPNRLVIEALRHWPRQLSKFRVVLTHTYSNENTATWLDQSAPPDRTLPALRAALRNAFGATSHFKSLDRTSLHWLYPVEFGDSWRAVADPDGRGARRLRDQAMTELQRDLALAVQPENRLRRTFETHGLALEIAGALRQSWDDRISRTRRKAERLAGMIRDQTVLVERQVEEIAAIDRALDAVDKLEARPLDIGMSAPQLITDDGQADIGGMQGRLRVDATAAWRAFAEAERKDVRPAVQGAGFAVPAQAGAGRFQAETDTILQEAFAGLELPEPSALALFFFYRSWQRELADNLSEAGYAYERAARRIHEMLQSAADRRIRTLRDMLTAERMAAAGRSVRKRESLAATRAELTATHERMAIREAERITDLALMDQHVEVAGQFPAHLEREYHRRRAELLMDVAAARTPLEKLAAGTALVQAAEIYDRIRSGE
jgi:hypothetical protein